jgi:hypothetical protein
MVPLLKQDLNEATGHQRMLSGMIDGYGLRDARRMKAALSLAAHQQFKEGMNFQGNLL